MENPAPADKGLLLNIADYPGYDFFELTSGEFAKEYITIWGIFDDIDKLNQYIKELTAYCISLKDNSESDFSVMVTSTNTVKAIAELLVPQINEQLKRGGKPYKEISLLHFGDYPSLDFNAMARTNLETEKILVLADVIATGTLVKKLCRLIYKLNGVVVGIIGIFLTGEDLQDTNHISIEIDGGGEAQEDKVVEIKLYHLFKYKIEYNKRSKGTISNGLSILPIDPITILPKDIPQPGHSDDPVFTMEETFDHFREANAFLYGFYKFGNKRFTTSFNIEKLLYGEGLIAESNWEVGDEIWSKLNSKKLWRRPAAKGRILKSIADFDVIVTTCSREDVIFVNFINERLKQEDKNRPRIITIKRETKDSPYFYFTINNNNRPVSEKNVLLLLSTVSTTEKLRNITSLLADFGAASVKVVALISRMGAYTSNFIHRINNLFVNKEHQLLFEFRPLYSFCDFDRGDLERMSATIVTETDRIIAKSRVQVFRRDLIRYRNLLLPTAKLDEYLDEKNAMCSLSEPYPVTEVIFKKKPKSFEVDDEISKLCYINYFTSYTRDYSRLISQFRVIEDFFPLFHITGLAILDIDFLRFSGQVKKVNACLLSKIDALRLQKIEVEEQLTSGQATISQAKLDELENIHEQEMNLMVSYSLIALFQEPFNIQETFIEKFIFHNYSVEEWKDHPVLFKLHFDDVRVHFCLTIILFANNRNFQVFGQSEKLKKYLTLRMLDMLKHSETYVHISKNFASVINIPNAARNFPALQIQLLKNNFNLTLLELGYFNIKTPHQIIRYLHAKLYAVKGKIHHILFYDPLKRLIDRLERIELMEMGFIMPVEPSLQKELKSALLLTSDLQTAAQIARYFFDFIPGVPFDDQKKYIQGKNGPGFPLNVSLFEDKIVEIEEKGIYSREDVYKLQDLFHLIFDDELTNIDSVLNTWLKKFIVSPQDVIETIKKSTTAKDILIEFQGAGDIKVLADFSQLTAAIDNIISNMQHHGQLVTDVITIEVKDKIRKPVVHSAEEADHTLITISGKTRNSFDASVMEIADNTLSKDNTLLRQYGGQINYKETSRDNVIEQKFEIDLISRTEYNERHIEEWQH